MTDTVAAKDTFWTDQRAGVILMIAPVAIVLAPFILYVGARHDPQTLALALAAYTVAAASALITIWLLAVLAYGKPASARLRLNVIAALAALVGAAVVIGFLDIDNGSFRYFIPMAALAWVMGYGTKALRDTIHLVEVPPSSSITTPPQSDADRAT